MSGRLQVPERLLLENFHALHELITHYSLLILSLSIILITI